MLQLTEVDRLLVQLAAVLRMRRRAARVDPVVFALASETARRLRRRLRKVTGRTSGW